jgi:hypothetical protein
MPGLWRGARPTRWRRALVAPALVGAWLALGPAQAAARDPVDQPSVDDAVAFVDTLALIRENPLGKPEAGWVRRWRGPVAVTLEGVAVPGFSAVVATSLKRISEATGLAFHLADHAGADGHIAIRVRHQGVVAASFGQSDAVCLTSTFGEAGELHRAIVDISEGYLDCLDHELMHALGFNNHWHGATMGRSIATVLAPRHSRDRRRAFSAWDILAIRTLYRAELPPGLERDEALPRLRAILLEESVVPAAGR